MFGDVVRVGPENGREGVRKHDTAQYRHYRQHVTRSYDRRYIIFTI